MKTYGILSLFFLALTVTSLTLPKPQSSTLNHRSIALPSTARLLPRHPEDDNNQSEVQDQESARDSSGGFNYVPIALNPNEKYPTTLFSFRIQGINLDKCPSLAAVLATLAVVNFLTIAGSFGILGFKKPMDILTFGRFSKSRPSDSLFLFVWAPVVLLIFAGYAASAALSKNAKGWHDFKLIEYAVFLFTLPRSGWFSIFYLARKNRQYTFSLHTILIAEFIMSTIGLYSMFITIRLVSFNDRGLLSDGKTPKVLPTRLDQHTTMTRVMLVGVSMFLLSYIGMVGVYLGTALSKRARALKNWGTYQAVVMGGIWAGSWVYWGAYMDVMGKEYCPAQVYVQGLIILIFGLLANVAAGTAA